MAYTIKPKDVERFWSKVDRGDPSQCWNWKAFKNTNGYGLFGFPERMVGAHRVAYEIATGKIPPGMFVCHHCDNPSCCNPAHLFVGNNQDNMRDKVSKNRQAKGEQIARKLRGEKAPASKLTAEKVLEIRALAGIIPQRKIGEMYGVFQTTISHIMCRRTWSHI